jgi:hypothetical protein
MAHPAVVLYNGSSEAIMTQFRSDFKVVKDLL